MVKDYLIEGLLIVLGAQLVHLQATGPCAALAIVLVAYKAFKEVRTTDAAKKVEVSDDGVKSRLSSIENKLALMGVSKRTM
jgi:hypothetical protein